METGSWTVGLVLEGEDGKRVSGKALVYFLANVPGHRMVKRDTIVEKKGVYVGNDWAGILSWMTHHGLAAPRGHSYHIASESAVLSTWNDDLRRHRLAVPLAVNTTGRSQ